MAEQENLIPLAGSLLIAHPGMGDPNFKKTVILMASHSAESGAIGIIINRPTELTLGEVDNETANTPLANVTIYQGGPIASKQLILTAWQWNANIHMFKLHFGLTKEMALQVHTSSDVQLKGFLGYAGWDKGQLKMSSNKKRGSFALSINSKHNSLLKSVCGSSYYVKLTQPCCCWRMCL